MYIDTGSTWVHACCLGSTLLESEMLTSTTIAACIGVGCRRHGVCVCRHCRSAPPLSACQSAHIQLLRPLFLHLPHPPRPPCTLRGPPEHPHPHPPPLHALPLQFFRCSVVTLPLFARQSAHQQLFGRPIHYDTVVLVFTCTDPPLSPIVWLAQCCDAPSCRASIRTCT
mgnify:CR=1 FL=1